MKRLLYAIATMIVLCAPALLAPVAQAQAPIMAITLSDKALACKSSEMSEAVNGAIFSGTPLPDDVRTAISRIITAGRCFWIGDAGDTMHVLIIPTEKGAGVIKVRNPETGQVGWMHVLDVDRESMRPARSRQPEPKTPM